MDSMRRVLFCPNLSITFMKLINVIIIDRTFNIVISNFTQPVSIHDVNYEKTYLSFSYFLLNSKLGVSYSRVFDYIKQNIRSNSLLIITIFECYLINAVKKTFSDNKIRGLIFISGRPAVERLL
ncbi:hypothetical protein CDIK_3998 [Cucumispora dikerogammari]|nr:hypothetical protein CDIK_3998 [Cucumispora dikerogammari]